MVKQILLLYGMIVAIVFPITFISLQRWWDELDKKLNKRVDE